MKRSIIKWGIAGALAGIAYVLLDAFILEQYYFDIRKFTIGNKNSSDHIKLVLITDLHFKRYFTGNYKRLVGKINKLQPDLLLITGDVMNTSGKPGPVETFFQRLDQKIPKAIILGNHDHKADISIAHLKRIYEQHNGSLLINESKKFTIRDHTIMVTGLDDFIEGHASLKNAVRNVGREDHHLLLVHSPLQQKKALEQVKKINETRSVEDQLSIQYIFAGHNHGGQVRIFGLAPVLPKKSGNYVNGWYNKTSPFLYVSKGIGTTQLPVRFGSRSEITVFEYGV
jgi:hypothetical protein